jgi:1,4-alpha-glucan branching enzyme
VVTFALPPEATIGPVWLCGEFNDWSTSSLPMLAGDDGRHVTEVELEPGRSYRFRYYLGESRWENDWAADSYVPNEFGGADSVVELPPVEVPAAADATATTAPKTGTGPAAGPPRSGSASPLAPGSRRSVAAVKTALA